MAWPAGLRFLLRISANFRLVVVLGDECQMVALVCGKEVYAIEATCHASDVVGCYKDMFRVLKPGQSFAAYEWCMTDAFDKPNIL
ncbi:hypothetical protein L1987_23380 [Smallanthus sonchifolius]|uniref:Uncharacterized protein n=1 Tax=Smallanthus sonchifolius TaxID=185202 RepID=A0ACB9II18_9ASTR|nr:hypothetical protein L1987_23380 [Smallanthus sonchifolius]